VKTCRYRTIELLSVRGLVWLWVGGLVALVVLVTLSGCGGDNDLTTPPDTPPDRGTYFVDPSHSGPEDGSPEKPFDSLDEAVAAASAGDTLLLVAGQYLMGGDLSLPRPVVIIGAGKDASFLGAGLRVAATDSSRGVVVKKLACPAVSFTNDVADYPSPIEVDSCAVDSVSIFHPANHRYVIKNSEVALGIGYAHGSGDCHHVVRYCTVGGTIGYAHADGANLNVVEDCQVGGQIRLANGGGATFSVKRNIIQSGIDDASGACWTTISDNHIPQGSIDDRSGGFADGLEDHIIENNQLDDGVISSKGTSVTIRNNIITCDDPVSGVVTKSGFPTNIVGNTITVPYLPLPPGFDWATAGDLETLDANAVIITAAGGGEISDNILVGGSVGIYDSSGAFLVGDNTISNCDIGIWTVGGGHFRNNTITDCGDDGMIFAATGPITGNTITGCGGAGIRLVGDCDLGGGEDGGLGGNILRNNAGYELVIEVAASIIDTIYAQFNLWDHTTESDIDEFDILDGKDDPTKSVVVFLPVGEERR